MRCVAWARASLGSPSPASCSCTLSPLWLTSLPTARTCWPENCPLCRCWLEIRICAGVGGTERVEQRRAGVRHGTHAAKCRSQRTRLTLEVRAGKAHTEAAIVVGRAGVGWRECKNETTRSQAGLTWVEVVVAEFDRSTHPRTSSLAQSPLACRVFLIKKPYSSNTCSRGARVHVWGGHVLKVGSPARPSHRRAPNPHAHTHARIALHN